MTGLRSAGLLVLLLGVTISVARAQYGDYQGAGASRGYDGEYDYAEGEDDYDEEDYNTDLAAQSYDYEEQIQGDECVHDNGETQVPGSLHGCEFWISGSDRIFQGNIESLDGIYTLEGCRKGYPFYLRKSSRDSQEPRMLWFHPDFKDWVISNTDDKSLAGKSRYWMAYSDEEADRAGLPSTKWHASRDLSVATDDFYTNFEVNCVKNEQGDDKSTEDRVDYGDESVDSQPADMLGKQENKEMQDDDAEDWDEYENVEDQRDDDGDLANAEGNAREEVDDIDMYAHPEEDLADATENGWDDPELGEADENLMKLEQVDENIEDDLSQELDMKLREAENNVDDEEEDMEEWVEYDYGTKEWLEEAEDVDGGEADEEELDQYEDNAEERLVEAWEKDDELDEAYEDWGPDDYETADKLAEPDEDEEEWAEYEDGMEERLEEAEEEIDEEEWAEYEDDAEEKLAEEFEDRIEEAEKEVGEEEEDEEWAEYEDEMEERLEEEFEDRLEEAEEEIDEADEEEWAEYEDDAEEQLAEEFEDRLEAEEEVGEEEEDEEWAEYEDDVEEQLAEEFEDRLEEAEEEIGEEEEDEERAENEYGVEEQLDEEFEDRLEEAKEDVEAEADEDREISQIYDDLKAEDSGDGDLEDDEYDLQEEEFGEDFTQEQQSLEEELEHTEDRLEKDYNQLMAAEAASVDAPYEENEDRIEEYEDKVEEEYNELLEEMFERELVKEPEDAEKDTAKNSGAMAPVADGEEDAWGEYEAEKAAGDDWPSLTIDSASTFPSKGHVTIIGGILLIILGTFMYSAYSCFSPSLEKSNRRHYERFSDSRRRAFDLEDGDVEEKLR